MGGHGHRNMYYVTGLPGWMRFGSSPGWIGRSSGLGPAAQYLMYGTWPTQQMVDYWQQGNVPVGPLADGPLPKEKELEILKNQAAMMQGWLEKITNRITEIEEKKK